MLEDTVVLGWIDRADCMAFNLQLQVYEQRLGHCGRKAQLYCG